MQILELIFDYRESGQKNSFLILYIQEGLKKFYLLKRLCS